MGKVDAPGQADKKMEVPESAEQEKQAPSKKKCPRLRKFLKNFFLWVAGTAVGVIPIYLKQSEIAATANFPETYNFWKMILSDFDFSFTSVNALFVLFLEGCLLSDDFPAWKAFLRTAVFICLFATAVVYCSHFSYRDHFSFFWRVTQYEYNMLTLGLATFFGLICHIAISRKKENNV